MAAALDPLATAFGPIIVLTLPNLTYLLSLCQFHKVAEALGQDPTRPNIRPTKCVHPTYKSCASNLQKVFIRPTKLCIRPTKVFASDLHICVQQEQRDPYGSQTE